MPNIADKSLSGILWVGGGGLVKAIVQFIPIIVLTRLLTPEEFGIFTLVLVVVQMSELIAFGGIGPSLVQAKTLTKSMVGAALWVALGIGLALAITIALLAGVISQTSGMSEAFWPLIVCALGIPINAMSVIGARLQQRDLHQAFQVKSDILSYLVGYYALGISLAYMGFGVWALIGAFLIQSLLRSALHTLKVWSLLSLKTDGAALKDMARSSFPVMLSNLVVELQLNLDKFIVGYAFNAATLGIYGRASDLFIRILKFFDQIIQRVTFPALSRQEAIAPVSAKDTAAILALSLWCIGPIILWLSIFSGEIISLAFGSDFQSAASAFRLLVLAIIPLILARILSANLQAKGLFTLSAKLETLGAIIVFGSVLFSALTANIASVALAILLSSIVKFVIFLFAVFGFRPETLKHFARALISVLPILTLSLLSMWAAHSFVSRFESSFYRLLLGSGSIALLMGASLVVFPQLFCKPIRPILLRLDFNPARWLLARL